MLDYELLFEGVNIGAPTLENSWVRHYLGSPWDWSREPSSIPGLLSFLGYLKAVEAESEGFRKGKVGVGGKNVCNLYALS